MIDIEQMKIIAKILKEPIMDNSSPCPHVDMQKLNHLMAAREDAIDAFPALVDELVALKRRAIIPGPYDEEILRTIIEALMHLAPNDYGTSDEHIDVLRGYLKVITGEEYWSGMFVRRSRSFAEVRGKVK